MSFIFELFYCGRKQGWKYAMGKINTLCVCVFVPAQGVGTTVLKQLQEELEQRGGLGVIHCCARTPG